MKNIGVVLAGGVGVRFQSGIPKAFTKLNGKPVISYVIDEFKKSNLFTKIIVTVPSYDYKYLIPKDCQVIKGGGNRTESVDIALKTAAFYNPDNILFHDAVRPLLKAEELPQFIDNLKDCKGVITVNKITDSLFPFVDRDKFLLVQTPEAFRYRDLVKEFDTNKETTAVYQHFKNSKDITTITLTHSNYKLTNQQDLFMLEYLVKFTSYKRLLPDLKNKTIVVFGANGGVGKAVVNALKNFKCEVITVPHKEVDDFFVFNKEKVDVIINAAGAYAKDKDGWKEYHRVFDANVGFNIHLITNTGLLKNRPVNIVSISSSSATKGREGLTLYSASKAALQSIIESQGEELAKKKIYFNCICPEKIDTPLLKKLHGNKYDKREVLSVEDVVDAILSYCDVKTGGQIIPLRKGFY